MRLLLLLLSLFPIPLLSAQNIEAQLQKEVWGEVNKHQTEHRGKAGLILLDFNEDFTFRAFENTCTGDAVLQSGQWKVEKDTLVFTVMNTKHYQAGSTRTGKILAIKKTGIVTYKIIKLTEDELAIENIKDAGSLHFKISKFIYFPGK